jgi:hypothetical protein
MHLGQAREDRTADMRCWGPNCTSIRGNRGVARLLTVPMGEMACASKQQTSRRPASAESRAIIQA